MLFLKPEVARTGQIVSRTWPDCVQNGADCAIFEAKSSLNGPAFKSFPELPFLQKKSFFREKEDELEKFFRVVRRRDRSWCTGS